MKEIKPTDILVEKTPIKENREIYELSGFKIYNLRKREYEAYPVVLDSLNDYLKNNKRVYVFCNPEFYDDIRRLNKDDFNKIFGSVIP